MSVQFNLRCCNEVFSKIDTYGESSQAELCRCHNLSEDQLSKWKQQRLENASAVFAATDQHSREAAERIAHLEQLVGRLTVALDIEKKPRRG